MLSLPDELLLRIGDQAYVVTELALDGKAVQVTVTRPLECVCRRLREVLEDLV